MTEFRGDWTQDQLESFLDETTVPVRLATHRPDGSLWIVTLWFRYRDEGIECATRTDADVVRFLRSDSAVGFDISTNHPPYRGVRGHGTVSLAPDTEKAVLRDLVERYLGDTDSSLAAWLLDEERDETRIRIEPDVCFSWDYSDRMADVEGR